MTYTQFFKIYMFSIPLNVWDFKKQICKLIFLMGTITVDKY